MIESAHMTRFIDSENCPPDVGSLIGASLIVNGHLEAELSPESPNIPRDSGDCVIQEIERYGSISDDKKNSWIVRDCNKCGRHVAVRTAKRG